MFVPALACFYQDSYAINHKKLQRQNPVSIIVPKLAGAPPATAFSVFTTGASTLPLYSQWSEKKSEPHWNRKRKKRGGGKKFPIAKNQKTRSEW